LRRLRTLVCARGHPRLGGRKNVDARHIDAKQSFVASAGHDG